MPPYTTLRTFIDALKSGETNITRVLEDVAADRALLEANAADLRTPGRFEPYFPDWARAALTDSSRVRRLSAEELAHIEAWPASEKEAVRVQLARSLDAPLRLIFRWEIFDGDDPRTELRRDEAGEAEIVFRSPRKGVELISRINVGDIKVAR
jgi:hypothetical protein